MLPPLVLRIDTDLDGGWSISLGTCNLQPAHGRLPPEDVAAILAAAEAWKRPQNVAIRGQTLRIERAEADVGRALARVFEPRNVRARFVEHRSLATAKGAAITLVIDCAHAPLAALPWELIAEAPDGPPMEERVGAVVRLSQGHPALSAPPTAQLRLLLWCPTPDEPACQAALQALGSLDISGVTVQALSALHPFIAQESDSTDILMILCHGSEVEGGTLLLLGKDGAAGPGSVVAALSDHLPRLASVVVGVCSGGAPSAHQLNDLAGRLLLAGAAAVFCAADPVSTEALAAFTHTLLQTLTQEAPPAMAARSARHAVGRLLIPHADSRPSTFRMQIADLSTIGRPWVLRHWRPDGWPTTAADLSVLLSRARTLATGWIGIEHLIEAWPEDAPGLAGALRRGLVLWDEGFLRRLRAGHQPRVQDGPLLCTPRLRRLAAALPGEPRGLVELAGVFLDDPTHALHLLTLQPLAELRWDPLSSQLSQVSLGGRPLPDAGVPATRFEVLWGPEDGRRIQPLPGQTIGRWHSTPVDDHLLFEETPVIDRHLHRRHLRYLEPGLVELLHAGQIIRHGTPWQAGGEARGRQTIRAGDVLLLTPGTWLRALGPG